MADSIIPNIPVYPPQGIQAELNLIYLYNPDIALGYVTHDATLNGVGTKASPLTVANPVPAGGTAGQVLSIGNNGITWLTLDYYTTSQVDSIVSNLQTSIGQTYLSKTDAANTYATQDALEAVEAKLSAVYRFRGSVATYNNLPTTDNTVGDVWNVEDTGANYAWTGTVWDKLSETIDLTPYLTKEDAASTYATKDSLTTGLSGKQDTLTTAQMNAVNSGITTAKVATYDSYQTQLEDMYSKEETNQQIQNAIGTIETALAEV